MRLLPEKSKLLPSGKALVPRSRWRRGAFFSAMAAFFTFTINLSFILWATSNRAQTLDRGIGTISEGTCPKIKQWNTTVHITINIISTILLAGSDYCMQCLIAPTRLEVDEAHSRLKSLEIGVPSIRNFWNITFKRKILWPLLSISSFPLHLLYDIIYFCSLSFNEYAVYTVNAQFLEVNNPEAFLGLDYKTVYIKLHAAVKANELKPLSLQECLNKYSVAIQSSRGALLLVVADDVKDDEAWRKYTIGGSNPLCWAVTALNLLKGILMLFVAFGSDEETPLLTVGDAVASCMKEEDTSTESMCLAPRARIKKQNWDKIAVPYEAKPRRKFAAASFVRWITCISLWGVDPNYGITKYGLGEVHALTIMNNYELFGEIADQLLINVMLANTPQVIVSLLYFNYNALFTSISVATEWDSAAISAACHPGTYEKDAWKMPLRWGVVSEPRVEPRHCSFSSKPVEKPVEGQPYA
ncbi:hypothetical protein CSOJ01_11575 [Colletotrichum sojae]|uniref:DUF6536 domain-containing protein n=1 Tax=Colletotrichum sojae TaxID=2175907 RepID=A0A8H6IXQ8_9PEZI|nr:hypothetical protein CSOJ01_11575 [Colletotrichum sojae]